MSNTDQKKITIRISPEDYELIKAHADKSGKTLNAYVAEMAINKVVIDYNYAAIQEHTREVNKTKQILTVFINSLMKSNQVYQADINMLVDLMKELTDGERRMLQNTRRERDFFREYVTKLMNGGD